MMSDNLPHLLAELKQRLVFLSSTVEEAIAKATTAVVERNARTAGEVVAADAQIDNLEVAIEAECLRVLALHQPVARDLRFVIAVLRVNSDLERMGDLAKKIGKNVIYLCGTVPLPVQLDFRRIAEPARGMVRRALDAFVNADVELARRVLTEDDSVDQQKTQLYGTLRDAIRTSPEQLEPLLKVQSIVRNFERLGDMATHIAEEVVYLVEGDIVRHQGSGA